jgi:small subunit ribosomal protein S21
MIEITLQDGDRIEWALKALKRQVLRSRLFQELRRRRHYVQPSEARQLKDEAALRRARAAPRRAAGKVARFGRPARAASLTPAGSACARPCRTVRT